MAQKRKIRDTIKYTDDFVSMVAVDSLGNILLFFLTYPSPIQFWCQCAQLVSSPLKLSNMFSVENFEGKIKT